MATSKKTPAKKAPAKKAVAKKTPAKKAPAKKSPAKKAVAKTTAKKPREKTEVQDIVVTVNHTPNIATEVEQSIVVRVNDVKSKTLRSRMLSWFKK